MKKFEAELLKGGRIGVYIKIPFDVEKVFGNKGQVKVKVTFDGYLYRSSLVPMGDNQHVIGVKKEIRTAIKKDVGDFVFVTLEIDTEKRIVIIPADIKEAFLTEEGLFEFYTQMCYTHRKEVVEWITSAKKIETRNNLIIKAITILKTMKEKKYG